MKPDTEDLIVNLFFRKNFRKRIKYELKREDKRRSCLDRLELCYYNKYLVMDLGISLRKIPLSDHKDLLVNYGAEKSCYLLGIDIEDGGAEAAIDEAIEIAWRNQGACLVYCGNGVAYFTTEIYLGSQTRTAYLLYNKNYLQFIK